MVIASTANMAGPLPLQLVYSAGYVDNFASQTHDLIRDYQSKVFGVMSGPAKALDLKSYEKLYYLTTVDKKLKLLYFYSIHCLHTGIYNFTPTANWFYRNLSNFSRKKIFF